MSMTSKVKSIAKGPRSQGAKVNRNKPRCPSCQSLMVHIRIKTNELVCKSCGRVSQRGAA